jgi:Uma2 family endonuclease
MSTQQVAYLTAEQYLELDAKNEFRSEFVDGKMLAMAEPSCNHSWIMSHTLGWLGSQLRGRPCGARTATRLHIPRFDAFTYPDIVVTCGADVLHARNRNTIADATAIVEVLSPSTKNYDRSAKFDLYRSLPSFAEYLVLAQDAMRAEHRMRMPDASWLLREFTEPTAIVELKSIGCRLELQTLYHRVEFEAEVQAPVN